MSLSQALNQFAQNLGRYQRPSFICQSWFNRANNNALFELIEQGILFTNQ